MQIKAEKKTTPVTYREALTALWCVKLLLGQYPIRIWPGNDAPSPAKQQGRI